MRSRTFNAVEYKCMRRVYICTHSTHFTFKGQMLVSRAKTKSHIHRLDGACELSYTCLFGIVRAQKYK